jgi:hypothetical protein
VNNVEEAVAKVEEAAKLDRKRIRAEFEKRFTSAVMAERYQDLFYRIRDGRAWTGATPNGSNSALNDSDADINDNDQSEHVCPGHHLCALARAQMNGTSGSGSATDVTDDLADDFAEIQAGEVCAAK